MLPHVPFEPEPFFAVVHAWQVPAHAVLQHTPSTQLLLVHSPLIEHAVPFENSAHEVDPLHEAAPAHSLSGSVPTAMLPHVPFAPEPFFAVVHAWQVAVQAVLQHTPSTHWLLVHSPFCPHGVPFAYSAHEVAPLHSVGPGHSLSGSSPAMMVAHTPSMP